MRKDRGTKDADRGEPDPDPTTEEAAPIRPTPGPEFRDDEFEDSPPSGTFRIPRI